MHPMRNAVKYMLIGAAAGFALTVLLALMRKTVCSEEDLKNLTSVKYLGSIPAIRSRRRGGKITGGVSVLNEKVSDYLDSPIRGILVPLLRAPVRHEGGRVLLVTSTVPGEGKTTASFNLAACLAQSGKRVILIDGDLRHQSIKGRFGIKAPSAGLIELSRAPKPDVSRVLLSVPNSELKLLAGDPGFETAPEFLDSDKMRNIISQCRSIADVVVIDAPPAAGLADAAVLSRIADQIVYVIRHDIVFRDQAADTMQSLFGHGAEVSGYILNCVPRSRSGYGKSGYGYGSGHGYGYGYGYGYGKGYGKSKSRSSHRNSND